MDKELLKKEFDLINQQTSKFQLFERNSSALLEKNLQRNRYFDVLAEESTRVKLQDQNDSDYINANYVFVHRKKYISCQAPLISTISHFWKMVWEQRSPLIVMLTKIFERDRKKADVYWPDRINGTEIYDTMSVTLKSVLKQTHITIRTIILKNKVSDEQREIVQLHYTEWPDFGVPQTTLQIRSLIRLTKIYQERGFSRGLEGPIVSHCSAGIGRCGTFIAILICLERLTEGIKLENINLVDTVLKMRRARAGMIQTDLQYIFVYQTLDDIMKEKQLKFLSQSNKRVNMCRLSFEDLPLTDNEDIKKRTLAVSCLL
jgi:protein tyrosine phosphatase